MHPRIKFRDSLSLSLMDFTALLINQAKARKISLWTKIQPKSLGVIQSPFAITLRR